MPPLFITMMRSETAIASAWSCVTYTTVSAEALLQVADLLAHLPAQPRVEIGQRLVEQQHRGLEHQRARDRDALLLAARQLRRQPLRRSR